MIDVYAYGTGNGFRACIALAECELEHNVHKVDLAKGDNTTPEFLKMNPLGSIPVIVDHDGPDGKSLSISQSASIVLYAAEKSGRFLPSSGEARTLALQWLMFNASDIAGTNNAIFMATMRAPEKVPAVIEFFEERLYGLFGDVDERLDEVEYLAGDISVADLALYPFVALRKSLLEGREPLTNLLRWVDVMAGRPGVAKGMAAFS
jgi:GST-like protein